MTFKRMNQEKAYYIGIFQNQDTKLYVELQEKCQYFLKRQSMKIKWEEKSQNTNSDSFCDDFLYAHRHKYLLFYTIQIS